MNDFLLFCQDKEFIENIRKAFINETYGIEVASGVDFSKINDYSLVLIYSQNALYLLQEIRRSSSVGIIVIQNEDSFGYRFLEYGADDFLTMPIDFKELLARCRAVMRRSSIKISDHACEIRYEGLVINRDSYDVRIQNSYVPLSSREFEIMYLLASNPNKVLTRDEILNGAYGEEYMGDQRSVDVHIKKIRDKVENPNNLWSIKTVRGVGYKFSL